MDNEQIEIRKAKARETHKRWYKKNKVKANKYLKKWFKIKRATDKEYLNKSRAYIRNRTRKLTAIKYGITLEQYNEITTKCFICGFDVYNVDLHHKDDNHKNAKLSNFIGLCPNHHAMIHRTNATIEDLINIRNSFEEEINFKVELYKAKNEL